jgi:hypothetical protein
MTHLTLYPAIDLKDGAGVRLQHGALDHVTVYATDPAGPRSGFRTRLVQRKIGRFSMRWRWCKILDSCRSRPPHRVTGHSRHASTL